MTTIDQTALGRLETEGRLLNSVLKSPTKQPGRIGFRGDIALKFQARLADESVSRYGDNGFAKEAAEVLSAARAAAPLPFEPPSAYRNRRRDVSRAMKARGQSLDD